MRLKDVTHELFEADQIQESLKAYVSLPMQKYHELDMMNLTFVELLDDLQNLGLVDPGTAPMFAIESICGNLTRIIREEREKTLEIARKTAVSYDATPWKHDPAYAHVADMVAVEISQNIGKLI